MSLQCIAFEVSLVQMLERVHKLQLTSREKTIMDNEVEGMPSIVWSGSFQFPILLFQLSEFCRRWSREIKCPIDQVENEERRWSRLPCHVSHVTICYLVLWLLDMLEWLRECSLLFVFDVIIQSSTTCLQSREPKWQSCQVLVCIICLSCCSCHPQPGSILIKGEEFVRFDWEMKFIFLHSRVFRASEHSLNQQKKNCVMYEKYCSAVICNMMWWTAGEVAVASQRNWKERHSKRSGRINFFDIGRCRPWVHRVYMWFLWNEVQSMWKKRLLMEYKRRRRRNESECICIYCKYCWFILCSVRCNCNHNILSINAISQ